MHDTGDTLDFVDRQLLRELYENGRNTHQQLGEIIGRSPTSIARRQKQLEQSGIVRGYRAEIDQAQLGYAAIVHIKITLASQGRDELDAFESAIKECPSVVQCDLMSGSDDYLITVLARSLDDFARVHRDELSSLPGVVSMESGFVLRRIVEPRLPLGWAG